jgi:hypothetical protein
LSLDRYAQGFF